MGHLLRVCGNRRRQCRMSPLRTIIQLFFAKNHHIITEKLANSYPMRRAAQLVAHVFFRAEGAVKKAVEDASKPTSEKATSFDRTSGAVEDGFIKNFKRHLKQEIDEEKKKRNKMTGNHWGMASFI